MIKHLLWAATVILILQGATMFISTLTRFHWSDLAATIGMIAAGVVFFFSVTGDGSARRTEARGRVEARYTERGVVEKMAFFMNPVLTGAIIFTLISFSYPYFF